MEGRDSENTSGRSIRWRVLIVDDEPAHRTMCRVALDAWSGTEEFVLVGEARDGHTAIDRARSLQPDLVVLDLRMPGMSGLEALPQIADVAPRAGIVVWSNEGVLHRDLARELGAHAVVSKLAPPADLVVMLGRVARDRMSNI